MSNYEIFVYSWIVIGFLSFPFILRYDAPYGRHTSKNWGPLVDNKIAWIVMELPALIVCPLIVFISDNPLLLFSSIINDYDYVVDGSDNFKTKLLINDFCLKFKKTLVTGAISKFDGHIFTFNFKKKIFRCL